MRACAFPSLSKDHALHRRFRHSPADAGACSGSMHLTWRVPGLGSVIQEGMMGWGGLPGPSFVCPRRCSRSGLHHRLPSSGHGRSDPSTLFSGRFVVECVGGGRSSIPVTWQEAGGRCHARWRWSALLTWQPGTVCCVISEKRGRGRVLTLVGFAGARPPAFVRWRGDMAAGSCALFY